MSVIGVGLRAGSTFKVREIRCHACTATTSVRFRHPDDLARTLGDRGWAITRGVIACREHAWHEVMPRHRFSAVLRRTA